MKRPAERMDGMFDILPKFRVGRFFVQKYVKQIHSICKTNESMLNSEKAYFLNFKTTNLLNSKHSENPCF